MKILATTYRPALSMALMLTALMFATGLRAAESTAFDYGDVAGDISDFSFYKAPASMERLPRPSGLAEDAARNVIVMIGDGLAAAQVQMARLETVGADGRLHMERLPVLGLMRTHSASQLVTDSAAAGTAIASGIKTDNGKLGIAADGSAYETLLEAAQALGRRTGLVATSRISHATPAAFASHVENRNQEQQIAAQIFDRRINVLLGGGRDYWSADKRGDGRDLIGEAREAGYELVKDRNELQNAAGDHVLGLFTEGPLDTQPPEPMISEMTAKAIELLSSSDSGFFLMVEGSQIDWACHAHNEDNTVRQTLLFDHAVAVALDFAQSRSDTLLIVTSDHECGGLTVFGDDFDDPDIEGRWSSRGHSALDVPVYAYGPGAERFAGALDNTELAKHIAELMGVETFPRKLPSVE
jgi:alkaline phosphatase